MSQFINSDQVAKILDIIGNREMVQSLLEDADTEGVTFTLLVRDALDGEILKERMRQEDKFGQQNHSPFKYLAILGEEVGEANKAAIESYNWKDGTWNSARLVEEYRTELIQVAAVAKAAVECLDREIWNRKARNNEEA